MRRAVVLGPCPNELEGIRHYDPLMSRGRSRGTATVLFTDLVGSTDLLGHLGQDAFDDLRRIHFSLLRDACRRADGDEIKTLGDGVLCVFGTAADAISCAIAMQQAVERHARAGAASISIRVGLALGDVTFEDDDVFGLPVVEAARLVAVAEGGRILVTGMVRAAAGSSEVTFQDRGHLELKGLPEPVAAYEVLWTAQPAEALIIEGREAFRQGDAAGSRQAFEAALAVCEAGEALEGLARALYLEVDYRGSLEVHERAYTAYRREGDAKGAARVARMLAWLHGALYGDWAVANGWLGRAQRFLEEAGEDSGEYGWVELARALSETETERREQRFRSALAMGLRHGDADLEFEALAWLGVELVMSDRVEEGMVLLDEALAAVCAGEVDDLYVIEGTFCSMFLACERVQDIARAEQWVRAADDMVQRRNLVAIGGYCRAHYGGILTSAGRWREAEVELTEAGRIFERGHPAMRANVLVRLADLRIRQGRLEEAAQLLSGLDQHPDAVRPLAALHLSRGETALARDLLDRALARPESDAWVTGPLLALLVDAHLAEGAVDDAARAADQLTEAAARSSGQYLRACAALAHGKVCAASGAGDARACLLEALAAFSDAQMPAEVARARLELAKVVASERPEVAVAEAKAALEAFEGLEATRDADAAAALLRSLGVPARVGPKGREGLTKRELEVLDLLGHGLTNPEIAERLFISVKTAEHHVGRILSKLGLRNRAEAAAYATRTAGEKTRG